MLEREACSHFHFHFALNFSTKYVKAQAVHKQKAHQSDEPFSLNKKAIFLHRGTCYLSRNNRKQTKSYIISFKITLCYFYEKWDETAFLPFMTSHSTRKTLYVNKQLSYLIFLFYSSLAPNDQGTLCQILAECNLEEQRSQRPHKTKSTHFANLCRKITK